MSKDEFDIAMKLGHGKTIVNGDIINIINEYCLYEKLYVSSSNSVFCYLVPLAIEPNGKTNMRPIFYDDLLTQFYSF